MLDAVKEMTCRKAFARWRGWQFTSACAKQAEFKHGVVKLKLRHISVSSSMKSWNSLSGKELGRPRHVVALALKTAHLCVRRSVEVRGLTRVQIKTDGIHWTAAKRQRGRTARVGLIETERRFGQVGART